MGVTEQVIRLLQTALALLQVETEKSPSLPTASLQERRPIAWGAKVSQTFRDRVWWIAETLELNPDDLMSCMAWESAESFRADIKNAAGSGATGLIQFMPSTAVSLGTSTAKLARMTPEDQLNWVYRYFKGYKGQLKSVEDLYMAILWPAAVGKTNDFVLWNKATKPTTYRQNAGLDLNKNGSITKGEAAAKVREKLVKGLKPGYIG